MNQQKHVEQIKQQTICKKATVEAAGFGILQNITFAGNVYSDIHFRLTTQRILIKRKSFHMNRTFFGWSYLASGTEHIENEKWKWNGKQHNAIILKGDK